MAQTFTPNYNISELVNAKLASSGLTEKDGKLLGVKGLPAEKAHELGGPAVPCLYIPYFQAENPSQLFRTGPADPPFYRLRWLVQPAARDDRKYIQPADTPPAAYFPTNAETLSWPDLIQDPSQRLFITEGELKAAKAQACGYPCIGLGGVWSFQSKKRHLTFLPELDRIVWARRDVTIIFDSDIGEKSDVQQAFRRLHARLLERGACVSLMILPGVLKEGKTGLDDYLLEYESLDELEDTKVGAPAARSLWNLNDDYAIVSQQEGSVVVKATGKLITVKGFRSRFGKLPIFLPTGKDRKVEEKDLVESWLAWPPAERVADTTFLPGESPRSVVRIGSEQYYNSWQGWGVEPREGDCTLFLELVAHLFHGSKPEDMAWFLSWLAWPLQHPGVKMATSVVLNSPHHGVGKTFLGEIMGEIYGPAFGMISQLSLEGSFNEWAVNKQFVMGDDISGSDKKREMDLLKKMITQKTITVNQKNVRTFDIPDTINYLWTTNRGDAFYLEDGDRRFFVQDVIVGPRDDAFYSLLRYWLDHENGAAAVFHYLLNHDASNFNPQARAPLTEGKIQMLRAVKSDFSAWVQDLTSSFDDMVETTHLDASRDLFTLNEILASYRLGLGDDSNKISARLLGIKLREQGIHWLHQGQRFTGPGGKDRYYPLKNFEYWRTASPEAVKQHLDKAAKPPGAKY